MHINGACPANWLLSRRIIGEIEAAAISPEFVAALACYRTARATQPRAGAARDRR